MANNKHLDKGLHKADFATGGDRTVDLEANKLAFTSTGGGATSIKVGSIDDPFMEIKSEGNDNTTQILQLRSNDGTERFRVSSGGVTTMGDPLATSIKVGALNDDGLLEGKTDSALNADNAMFFKDSADAEIFRLSNAGKVGVNLSAAPAASMDVKAPDDAEATLIYQGANGSGAEQFKVDAIGRMFANKANIGGDLNSQVTGAELSIMSTTAGASFESTLMLADSGGQYYSGLVANANELKFRINNQGPTISSFGAKLSYFGTGSTFQLKVGSGIEDAEVVGPSNSIFLANNTSYNDPRAFTMYDNTSNSQNYLLSSWVETSASTVTEAFSIKTHSFDASSFPGGVLYTQPNSMGGMRFGVSNNSSGLGYQLWMGPFKRFEVTPNYDIILGGGVDTGESLQMTGTSSFTGVTTLKLASGLASLRFKDATLDRMKLEYNNTLAEASLTMTGVPLKIKQGASEAMTIETNAEVYVTSNLGVGLLGASLTAELDVRSGSNQPAHTIFRLGDQANADILRVSGDRNLEFSGRIGIGMTPTAKLDVIGTSANVAHLILRATDVFNTEVFSVKGDGVTRIRYNTGIGNVVTPAARLQVKGQNDTTTPNFIAENLSGVRTFECRNNGQITMASLPTSATGLSAGDIWNNAGVLNIV